MTTTEILEQAIEKLKFISSVISVHPSQLNGVVDELQEALALLDQLRAELVCPVCKGNEKNPIDCANCSRPSVCIALTRIGEPVTCPEPCPACSGKGDYRSWVEKQFEIAKEQWIRKDRQIALKDKQIEELKTRTHVAYLALNQEVKEKKND